MAFTIITEKEKNVLLEKAGAGVSKAFADTTSSNVLVLVSGGSALEVLEYITLPEGKIVTVGVIDERYNADISTNNFLQLKKTKLYRDVLARNGSSIDTSLEKNASFEELSSSMEDAFRTWKENNKDGKVVAILGVGEDGHIAGVMPFPENREYFERVFENSDIWVVGYDASTKNPIPLRATSTLSFLRFAVDESIVYVVGEQKRDILNRIVGATDECNSLPASILNEMKSVTLYTDIIL